MENMTINDALNQIGKELAKLPDNEIGNATNHFLGIINGMAIAIEMRNAKAAKDGAA